jgi:glycosyltransferase involved in cell wall biosynthesis
MKKFCLLICDEYFQDNAGTHRQRRWASNYLNHFDILYIFHRTSQFYTSISEVNKDSVFKPVSHTKPTTSTSLFHVIFRFLKHYFLLEFFLPSFLIFYIRLVKFILTNRGIFYIHISSPPFPFVFFATILVKKIFFFKKIYIHVDMRDPWAFHKSLGGIPVVKKYLENISLQNADLVTTVSDYLLNEFNISYNINSETVYNVATHFDNFNFNIQEDLSGKKSIMILYTGTIPYNFYDLRLIADLIVSSKNINNIIFKWHFVGECNLLLNELETRNIDLGNIFFLPRKNHKDLLELFKKADILLFFGHKFPGYLTTKLFEYFSIGKPILPLLVKENSDAFRLIKSICGTCPEIINELHLLYYLGDLNRLPKKVNSNKLDEYKSKYNDVLISFLSNK